MKLAQRANSAPGGSNSPTPGISAVVYDAAVLLKNLFEVFDVPFRLPIRATSSQLPAANSPWSLSELTAP